MSPRNEAPTSPAETGTGRAGPIAYVMSRFPRLTETFVLNEILAVERLGVRVEVFPLIRERDPVSHPEAAEIVRRARFVPLFSPAVLASQLILLARTPRRYLGVLGRLVRATLGSSNYLLGGLAIFPKSAHAARVMTSLGVRHVHCHFANHPAAAGWIISQLTGIPFSFTAHGSDLHVDHHALPEKVRAAAFVVAISEDNRREILEVCGPEAAGKVVVIHCGVDPEEFRPPDATLTVALEPANPSPSVPSGPHAASRLPAASGPPLRILCIGTLHEVKGQAYLIEACGELARSGVQFECRLVGDGPDRGRLEELVRRAALGDRVVFEGRRPRDEVRRYLGEADVLVAPSVPTARGKREGIPIVLMEAMSCGLPVVASRLSGIPELVADGQSGILVPPRDSGALAAVLRRLAADPALRTSLGRAARETVLREFELERNTRILLAHVGIGGLAEGEEARGGAAPAQEPGAQPVPAQEPGAQVQA